MKSVIFLGILVLSGCSPAPTFTPEAGSATPTASAQRYTCPMHPEVVTSAPGKCPKCQMDLVVKKI